MTWFWTIHLKPDAIYSGLLLNVNRTARKNRSAKYLSVILAIQMIRVFPIVEDRSPFTGLIMPGSKNLPLT